MATKQSEPILPGSPFRGAGGSLYSAFLQFITREKLFHPKDQLLLAVSGGLDSVVLCELCHKAGFKFAIAHCNFRLRDVESDGDEKSVEDLAKQYTVPFFVDHFNTSAYAREKNVSIQVAARELRYGWFKTLLADAEHRF